MKVLSKRNGQQVSFVCKSCVSRAQTVNLKHSSSSSKFQPHRRFEIQALVMEGLRMMNNRHRDPTQDVTQSKDRACFVSCCRRQLQQPVGCISQQKACASQGEIMQASKMAQMPDSHDHRGLPLGSHDPSSRRIRSEKPVPQCQDLRRPASLLR